MDKEIIQSGKDLHQLAVNVLKEYGISPEHITVIQGGSIKTVWKVQYSNKTVCLKRLKQTLDKALFSVHAQQYIKSNGGRVPGIYLALNGDPLVQYDDQLFVLYEWIAGRDLDFGSSGDLKLAIQGLAAFHIATKGYQPPEASRTSSKLARWPEQYESMKNKFITWKGTARQSSASCHAAYTKTSDRMIELASRAQQLLSVSEYTTLTAADSSSIVLCHQDYGRGNALLAPEGVYVLDLDGVTYDLPARDLRKLIGKQAENRGQWNMQNITDIVGYYGQINPLNPAEKQVLWVDLLFPHWYFGLVKNLFLNNKLLKAGEIERIASLEQSKLSVLQSLLEKR